jgi:hypothetical protein
MTKERRFYDAGRRIQAKVGAKMADIAGLGAKRRAFQRRIFFRPPDLHSVCTGHPQVFHIRGPRPVSSDDSLTLPRRGTYAEWMVRAVIGLVVAVFLTVQSVSPAAAQAGPSPLLRLFLMDGTSLTSFGEWARMDDKVVFSLPLSADPAPEVQLVTLAAARVDWPKTERYAATARAVQYASTRAEDDYAQFSNQVATVLSAIAREPDPKHRLALAEAARTAMALWPEEHHGYRATDVQQMLTIVDEVVGELRAASGQETFELEFTASTPPPPVETLLPPPTTAELGDQLLRASTLAEPAERGTLLTQLVRFIDRAAALLPESWATKVRSTALGTLAADKATDAAYSQLAATSLATATKHAKAANVRGIERVRAQVRARDKALGAKRPAEVTAILAALDADAETARRLRLSQDQWKLRAPAHRRYQQAVLPALRELQRAVPPLEDIREQAGPSPETLKQVMVRFAKARGAVVTTRPPEALAAPHALLQSAWSLADNAIGLRMRAIESGDSARAAEASAAAAGALMLMVRAREDIDKALRPPSLP